MNHKKLNTKVTTGLENLKQKPLKALQGKRLGLLVNQASVTSDFTHALAVINGIYPGQLKALFSPQHGFHGEKQDNMIESDHSFEPELNIPVFSLYSETRIPTREMFDPMDTLIIDLQDAGTRVYTFIYTISYCLEAAAKYGREVIILDRPNPVGGTAVEGNILKMEYASFVGRFPIPMRHSMTVGEISILFNSGLDNPCHLKVVPMEGWRRNMLFCDTALPWVPPSPNLPTPASAMVYPGQVIWEGTNISEGRGTAQPFELFGAPFLDTQHLLKAVQPRIKGAVLRPASFEPTSGKWMGKLCRGFQIHVTDPHSYEPFRTSLIMLQEIIRRHPGEFRWKEPPYEYEYERLPMDLILGDSDLRMALESAKNGCIEDIDGRIKSWEEDILIFRNKIKEFYLYA
ncbi:MAG: DUF1343 domain-containing protein [Desulfamplus sp.]|nr:DUF1343 domain-containing protein [Desulfamplus sp.]